MKSVELLPEEVLSRFMKGEHVMRHNPGFWNGIWSDMYIETTFMRYGHNKGGIIGITLKPEMLKVWALSLYTCNSLESSLDNMIEKKENNHISHKEESKTRIKQDSGDRKSLRNRLEICIDPFDPDSHPIEVINIVTGRIGPSSVTVYDLLFIGKKQMCDFEKSWSTGGFYKTIHKLVITMAASKKYIPIGELKLFNTNLIFSRVISLQASSRRVDFVEFIGTELAPIPTSMFTDKGDMRICTSKSVLKKELQVDISNRSIRHADVVVIDGSALLYVVQWPTSGIVLDFVNAFKKNISGRLKTSDVYLIFDRYLDYSTKGVTRSQRSVDVSRVHRLNEKMRLPPRNVILGVSKNKKQIIEMLCKSFIEDKMYHNDNLTDHKLIITGFDLSPVEINKNGLIILRKDMNTSHEEADIIIVQQMLTVAEEKPRGITILSDDTDVFVLLLFYYLQENLDLFVTMESPIKERSVIDIGKTVTKFKDIIPDILPAHALTGCDTVASYHGIGKSTVLKMIKSGLSLSLLGDTNASMCDILEQSSLFISACYGVSNSTIMSETRRKVWATKIGNKCTTITKLCALPPTNEAFEQYNVPR